MLKLVEYDSLGKRIPKKQLLEKAKRIEEDKKREEEQE